MHITHAEINVQTGEEIITQIDLTDEQEAELLASRKKHADQEVILNAKNNEKAALLTRLGITAEEAQLLLGGN